VTDSDDDQRPSLISTLPGVSENEYGPLYRDHVLDIYKLYLGMTDRISDRREKANSFFLAVNTAIIIVMSKGLLGDSEGLIALSSLVSIAGVTICYIWHRMIRSYRQLNSAKFKVVHSIECQLPLRPFDAEWEAVGRGDDPKLYIPFTHVEKWMPTVFAAMYVVVLLSSVQWGQILNVFC